MNSIIPSKPELPSWLYEPVESLDLKIATDLLAINFWAEIERMVTDKALSTIKKDKRWNITKPAFLQDEDLQHDYRELWEDIREQTIALIEEDPYTRARVMAFSSDKAFDQSVSLKESMDQVQIRIALAIEENGLLPYLEHDNIADYLLSKRIPWDGTGIRPPINRDIEWLAEYLIPVLEANGFTREQIIGVTDNFHKAREAVAYLREILEDVVTTTNEIKQSLKDTEGEERKHLEQALHEAMQLNPALTEILDALVQEIVLNAKNGGLSVRAFREKLKEIRNRRSTKLTPALGYHYNMGNEHILYISVESKRMLNAIMNQTGKLVDWHLAEPRDMVQETARIMGVQNVPDSN